MKKSTSLDSRWIWILSFKILFMSDQDSCSPNLLFLYVFSLPVSCNFFKTEKNNTTTTRQSSIKLCESNVLSLSDHAATRTVLYLTFRVCDLNLAILYFFCVVWLGQGLVALGDGEFFKLKTTVSKYKRDQVL